MIRKIKTFYTVEKDLKYLHLKNRSVLKFRNELKFRQIFAEFNYIYEFKV